MLTYYLNVSVFSIPKLQRYSIFLLVSTKWIVVDQKKKSHLLYVNELSEGFVLVFVFHHLFLKISRIK